MTERENEGQFALPTFPRPDGSTVTQLWNLEYSGTHNGLIHLTFAYDPALLPAASTKSALAIYHYNGTVWEKLRGTVDAVPIKSPSPPPAFRPSRSAPRPCRRRMPQPQL